MAKKALFAPLLLLALFVAVAAAEPDISGSWEVKVTPRIGGGESTFTLDLLQNTDNTISGKYDCNCPARRVIGPIKGSIAGATAILERANVAYSFFTLTFAGNKLVGEYRGRDGLTYDAVGTRR